ncbi:F-box protein skip19 [Trifolium pratense]|nr:F-box protein skip19 [Trifolium pratense]
MGWSCTKKPNWLELPTDLMKNILQRLDTLDIVMSVRYVCALWWNIYKDPLMWSTIRMCDIDLEHIGMDSLEKIARRAIDLSCGHMKEVYIDYFATDDLLKYLSER